MDAEGAKQAYILGNHFLAERTARQRVAAKGDPAKLANVQALNDACEEVIAIDYDHNRFSVELSAMDSDDSDKAKAKKAYLVEIQDRQAVRRAALIETIKACEAKL